MLKVVVMGGREEARKEFEEFNNLKSEMVIHSHLGLRLIPTPPPPNIRYASPSIIFLPTSTFLLSLIYGEIDPPSIILF